MHEHMRADSDFFVKLSVLDYQLQTAHHSKHSIASRTACRHVCMHTYMHACIQPLDRPPAHLPTQALINTRAHT